MMILTGCERDVDFDGGGLSPKIVVNSIIDARSNTHAIKISESVSDFSGQKPDVIENLEAHLYINGVECDNLAFDKTEGVHSYYKFNSQLNPNDKIEFSAYSPAHETVRGYDIVPTNSVKIKNIEHSWFRKDDIQYLRLYVTIQDNPQEKNFYRVIIKANGNLVSPSIQEPHGIWDLQEVLTDDEILFNEPGETDDEGKIPHFYKVFTDGTLGGEYTLNLYIKYDDYTMSPEFDYVRQTIKVEIQSLSDKLYRGLHSQELASGSISDLFSEPVKIYTNMQGGYGILGIYTCTEQEKIVAQKGE